MTADKVIYSKKIYISKEQVGIEGMIAIQNSQIIYVGNCDKGNEYVGDETEVLRLEDRVVLPGLIESHVHLIHSVNQELKASALPTKLAEKEWLEILNDKTKQLLEKGITSILEVDFLEDVCDGDVRIYYRYSQQPGKKVRVHYACSFAKKGQVEYYRRLQNDYLKFWGFIDNVGDENKLRNNLDWAYRQGIPARIGAKNQEEVALLLSIWNLCRKKYGDKQLQNGIVYKGEIPESQMIYMQANHIQKIDSSLEVNHLGNGKEIGREELGHIGKGMKADLTIMNPSDNSVYMTMIDGQIV